MKVDKKRNRENDVNTTPKLHVNDSEQKRLQSLQKKKQEFRAKKQLVREALNTIQLENTKNTKIVFDDDIDTIEENLTTDSGKKKSKKKKPALFDSEDEDNEEQLWNEENFNKPLKNQKVEKLQSKIGSDERFTVDERFIDQEDNETHQPENTKNSEEPEIDENKWQLQILESVLGKPIKPPSSDDKVTLKRKNMIRYDPTASNHKDHEIIVEKSEPEKKRKKKKRAESPAKEEQNPIPISNEIYTDVTNKLQLENEGEFNIFSLFDRQPSPDGDNKEESVDTQTVNFTSENKTKNPFLYDSSDNEEVEEKSNLPTEKFKSRPKDDRLFFSLNDARFDEAKQFFTKKSTEQQEFKHLRHELKQIVRSKIRNNTKKTVPWNRRRVRKAVK